MRKAMPPELRGFRVFLFSLLVCVPSSAILCASIIIGTEIAGISPRVHPDLSQLLTMGAIAGGIVGNFKALCISLIAFVGEPSGRWVIVVALAALSAVVEAWFWYQLATFSFRFG